MTDIVNSRRRSEMMAGIKGCDTTPEIAVRCIAYKLGLRFRQYRKTSPAAPVASSRAAGRRYSCAAVPGIGTMDAGLLGRDLDETDMPIPRTVTGSKPMWCIVSG